MECIAATIKSDRFEGRGEASVTTGVRGPAVNLVGEAVPERAIPVTVPAPVMS